MAHQGKTVSDDEKAARFLIASTFGSNMAEINAFPEDPSASGSSSGDGAASFLEKASEWVRKQIEDVPPTLHRARYRAHANPPNAVHSETGGVRGPCETKSRWISYAMTALDRASKLEVDRMVLLIDGMPRTLLTENVTLHEEDVGQSPWKVCTIAEGIGGLVRFGMNCRSRLYNPPVSFQGSGPAERVAMVNPVMVPVAPPAVDAFVLNQVPSACGADVGYGPIFART